MDGPSRAIAMGGYVLFITNFLPTVHPLLCKGMSDRNTLKPTDARLNWVTTGPTLRPWDIGPVVGELQELLRAHGFRLSISNEFDSHTEDCVLIFQQRQGIRADAIVGPKTWAALKLHVKPGVRALRKGVSGMDVYELQGLLRVNGYDIQRDGFFGEQTKQAVLAFQQQHKLQDTGRVDQVTWGVLKNSGVEERTTSHNFFARGFISPLKRRF
jgi:peptidoglycan hydrolase-like protein with peptidoglycan-binding domain